MGFLPSVTQGLPVRTTDVGGGRRPALKLPRSIIHDHAPRGSVLATPLLQDQTSFYQGDRKAQRPHGVLAPLFSGVASRQAQPCRQVQLQGLPPSLEWELQEGRGRARCVRMSETMPGMEQVFSQCL